MGEDQGCPVPPLLDETNSRTCSVHLKSAYRAGCSGRCCQTVSKQDYQTQAELIWFLKAGQTAQGNKNPVSFPSFHNGAWDWGIARDLEDSEVISEPGMQPDIALHRH
ncbi:hypothetical protein BsWGS_28440 [Bradybaena similaris]